jgi:hypothetical protein
VGYEDITLQRLQRRGQRANGLLFLFGQREHGNLFVTTTPRGSRSRLVYARSLARPVEHGPEGVAFEYHLVE